MSVPCCPRDMRICMRVMCMCMHVHALSHVHNACTTACARPRADPRDPTGGTAVVSGAAAGLGTVWLHLWSSGQGPPGVEPPGVRSGPSTSLRSPEIHIAQIPDFGVGCTIAVHKLHLLHLFRRSLSVDISRGTFPGKGAEGAEGAAAAVRTFGVTPGICTGRRRPVGLIWESTR